MKSIGVADARTCFSKLLGQVGRGKKITITRHGVPTALLVPVNEITPKLTHQEIVDGMRSLRKRVKPGKMTVRDMVNEKEH